MSSQYSNESIANTNDFAVSSSSSVEDQYDDTRVRVSKILGIPNNNNWTILDETDGLALVHYTDQADMTTYGHLRGVLVALEENRVIADSFGYTPTAVSSQLTAVDGVITVTDVTGVHHVFPEGQTFIKRVFEGVVIRVIWYKGIVYRITHRKIKPFRSRWGNSPFFLDMYEEATGPSLEQLFDTSKPYSSSCYIFLVVHPALLVGTRQKVDAPYVVHLATHQLNTDRDPQTSAPGLANFEMNAKISGVVSEPFIHDPQPLSIDEANHHLRFGYYNAFQTEDDRQLTGEACIMYRVIDGDIVDIVKVHSESYNWRYDMRGSNPNIAHQFFSLLDLTYKDIKTDDDWARFTSTLIPLPCYDQLALKEYFEQNPIVLTIPGALGTKENYATREQRIYLLWMNFLLSLPLSHKTEGLGLLDRLIKERSDLIDWIQDLEKKHKDIMSVDINDRVKTLIVSARKLAHQQRATGANRSQKGSFITIGLLIKKTIRNFIYKEYGMSLYKLINVMKQTKAAEEKARKEMADLQQTTSTLTV